MKRSKCSVHFSLAVYTCYCRITALLKIEINIFEDDSVSPRLEYLQPGFVCTTVLDTKFCAESNCLSFEESYW